VLNEGRFANFAQNLLPWQHTLRYQKRDPDRASATKLLSFGEKIAKIGPADPECQYAKRTNIVQFWHDFHFLPHFNSKTTEPIFTIFLHDLEQLVELLMRASARRYCILFQNTRAKSEDGQF